MTLHFEYLDRLKGFAMLCVVLGHIVCFTMYDTWDIAVQDINLAFVSMFGSVLNPSCKPTSLKHTIS